MNIVECSSKVYEIKLKETFRTALREIDSFKVFNISVTNTEGKIAEGECVSTPAIVGDNFTEFEGIFQNEIRPNLLKGDFETIQNSKIWPSLKSAVDCALVSLRETFPSISIATDVTLPVCEIESLQEALITRLNSGFSTIKLKLDAEKLETNIEKTLLVHEILNGVGNLRIDPNQAWSWQYTTQFLERIKEAGVLLEYIEQPVNSHDFEGLKSVKAAELYEVMADESCFTIEDAQKLIDLKACDWINIKLLKSGGLTAARQIAKLCLDSGIQVSVGSMLESPQGVMTSVRLAHEVAPTVVHDLDAAWWYQTSLIKYLDGTVNIS